MNKKVVIGVDDLQMWKRFHLQGIALENVIIKDETSRGQYVLAVIGKVRVVNSFHDKNVFARVTFDDWLSYNDYRGTYLESSGDRTVDVFSFGLSRRDPSPVSVEFAVSCIQGGKQVWDSNAERNYKFFLVEDPFHRNITAVQPRHAAESESIRKQVATQESKMKLEETVSEYPQFKAHPLTPTKITRYTYAPDQSNGSSREHGVVTENVHPVTSTLSKQAQSEHQESLRRLSKQDGLSSYLAADSVEVIITKNDLSEQEQNTGSQCSENSHDNEPEIVLETIEPVKNERSSGYDDIDIDTAFPAEEPRLNEIEYQQAADGMTNEAGNIHIDLQISEEPGDGDNVGKKDEKESITSNKDNENDEYQQTTQNTNPELISNGDNDADKDNRQKKKRKGPVRRFFSSLTKPCGANKEDQD